jgi:MFS family permease
MTVEERVQATPSTTTSAFGESAASRLLKNRWWIVVASVLGVIVGQGPITIFTFGVFLRPVSEELALSRGTLSSALVLLTIAAALATPIVGKLMDRYGIRRALLPLIVLFACSTAALSLLGPSVLLLYLLFVVQGVFSAGQTPTGYVKAISAWFDRERGLALGIAMTGVGLGVAVLPPFSALMINTYGWRAGYVGLGLAILVLAALPVALFVREPELRRASVSPAAAAAPGLTLTGAWRTTNQVWMLTLSLFLAVAAINGVLAHIVALLSDRGFSQADATGALTAAGLALIVGRIIAGYCLDRVFGPWVAIFFFMWPVIGIAMLLIGAGGPSPALSAVFCGLGVGAEIDVMAFLVGRYFGLRAFGVIYGTVFAFFTVGSGLGPYVMGLSHDLTHSYDTALVVLMGALLIACGLMAALGPYRYPVEAPPA